MEVEGRRQDPSDEEAERVAFRWAIGIRIIAFVAVVAAFFYVALKALFAG